MRETLPIQLKIISDVKKKKKNVVCVALVSFICSAIGIAYRKVLTVTSDVKKGIKIKRWN